MAGKVKVTIGANSKMKVEMTGFENCARKTKALLKKIGVEVDVTTLKDEAVTVGTGTKVKVPVKA